MVRLGAKPLWGRDVEEFRRRVRLADELGYEVVAIGDSPAAWQDVVVSLTIAASEAPRLTLATAVTTPFLRHPLTLARAMLSVSELTDAEVVIGFGAGESAPAGLGRRGGTLAEVREYVLALRALLNGESAMWDGRKTSPLSGARPLRIFLAADGPKQLRLAGEIADGAIVIMGFDMRVVDWRLEQVRDGARDAGRDPAEIEIWATTFASVRDSRSEAIDDIAAYLAMIGSLGMERAWRRELVPPELQDAIEEMRKHYDPKQHIVVGSPMTKKMQELGLTDFLAGLCGLAGTAEDVRSALARLEEREISCVLAAVTGGVDPEGTLRRFAAAAHEGRKTAR